MNFCSPNGPAASDRVQTVQAEAGEVGGGKGVLGDVEGEEGEAGMLGHWTAVMGTGRAWVSAAQNMSEGPSREKKCKKTQRKKTLIKSKIYKSTVSKYFDYFEYQTKISS